MSWLDKLVIIEKTPAGGSKPSEVAKPVPVETRRLHRAMETPIHELFATPGRNSADTVIKLREGLASFPESQQLVMLRAMDGADASWDEASAINDAQARLTVLDQHLAQVQADAKGEESHIEALCAKSLQDSQDTIAELDRQIAALQQARETAVSQITATRANANIQISAVRDKVKEITEMVAKEAAKYQDVIKFFK